MESRNLNRLLTKQRANITAAVDDVQDQHYVILGDAMDDQIVVYREAAESGP
jgi:phenylpyruvate tautomerase PptA (4-oxalocrotonate tautomerase family)